MKSKEELTKAPSNKVHGDILSLAGSFSELAKSTVEGVAGVWLVRSRQPGPVVGVTIMTHGNEPAGLAAYRFFRHTFALQKKLKRGCVYFVLNNIEAGTRYFAALKKDRPQKELSRHRFVHINMNRLPEHVFTVQTRRRSEVARAKQLQPIWSRFTHALDLHSTSRDSDPMVIALARSAPAFIRRMPIKVVLTNIDQVQIGKPASFFYGGEQAHVYGLECGGDHQPESLKRAIEITQTFLSALGMIDGTIGRRHRHQVFRIIGSIVFTHTSYKLIRPLKELELLKKGAIIGRGIGKPVRVPMDGVALMAPRGLRPSRYKEEVLFIAEPPVGFFKNR